MLRKPVLIVLLATLATLCGCSAQSTLLASGVNDIAAIGPVVQSNWALGDEVTRSGEALISAYDNLAKEDAARVPVDMLPAARAARIAALMVVCRLVLEVSDPREIRMSQVIAAKMWESLQAERHKQQSVAPQPDNKDTNVLDINTSFD